MIASQWQNISTAPRDGTVILLWAPAWRWPSTGWTFADDPWQECPYGGGKKEWQPTHWMHLPQPPLTS